MSSGFRDEQALPYIFRRLLLEPRIAPSCRDPPSIATDPRPQGHAVFQTPLPAAIPARLGPRDVPDGAQSSAAWTSTARLGKVGPRECPGLDVRGARSGGNRLPGLRSGIHVRSASVFHGIVWLSLGRRCCLRRVLGRMPTHAWTGSHPTPRTHPRERRRR
jgi:hypothetical protein